MQDPRALANTANLTSYRAWGREGAQRSGFLAMVMIGPLLTPVFTLSVPVFARVAGGGRAGLVLIGAALAVYLAACLGLAFYGVHRMKAWRAAHPWQPPAPRNPGRGLTASHR